MIYLNGAETYTYTVQLRSASHSNTVNTKRGQTRGSGNAFFVFVLSFFDFEKEVQNSISNAKFCVVLLT